jgi:hypothetical protein
MPAMKKQFARFAGIRDKEDPLRSEKEEFIGMRTANNMDIDNNLKIKPAPGFTQVDATSTEDIYYSSALKRCYIIRGGDLYEYFKDGSAVLLYSDVGNAGEWDEINGVVYFTNGSSFLVITGFGVREWGIEVPPVLNVTSGEGSMQTGDYQITATYRAPDGRESGALAPETITCTGSIILSDIPQLAGHDTVIYMTRPDGDVLYEVLAGTQSAVTMMGDPQYGDPIATLHLSNPPGGELVAEHQGRMCLGEYFPEANLSAIWRSEPLGYELFNRYSDSVIIVPGKINIIGSSSGVLILGTDNKVYGYTEGGEGGAVLAELLEVGSVAKTLTKDIDGQVWFWTNRGAAKAMPFSLVTDDYFAAPTAVTGKGAIINRGGFSKYNVILTEASSAINQNER